ncbi:two-component system sensor histidine kinase SenX3 [Cryobacterium mesophilum]|uniref:Sensor-like histidine kinase SenX3 n=1 Tax=Terrimesophilobacter mesophilus TaxID=433647 RepID=A0A4R8VAJ9_9MICO|nr:ATP-binding protein [Terrimesophilobacter mesophilus]MBB5632781.1 two-component system sensor histidine kinase SenX3 [Terrimesophilobacter mesophilus]TFB79575.1 two-component sensor histidine kinase [Terrimesophilobacter mesophilus]
MDPTWLVLASIAFGIVLGSGVVLIVTLAARRGRRAADVVSPSVPDGVDQVIDALESGGIVLDPSNNVIKSSPGALALGLVWNDALVHQELVAIVDDVRRYGEPIVRELELQRGRIGDTNIFLLVRVARLGARYVLLLAEDRTESVKLDAVRRDFIANISHELKTPIGAVGLLAEALQAAAKEPDQVKRFAKRLTKESERLARITQEIIELSRLQAADALARPETVEIDHVVAAAIDHNRVAAEARDVTMASGGDAGAEVFGDDALLTVALQNLISNAIIYSPKGSRVGIGVRNADGIVEIAVTDQGIGIAAEEQDRVFERFYRIDPARSRHTGGSGLGLSIVKHVVQNHGGDIRVWSQPGYGSTFTIRLPEASHATAVSLVDSQGESA